MNSIPIVNDRLLNDQEQARKQLERKPLKAVLLLVSCFVSVFFIGVLPDQLALIAFLGWPILLVYSFVRMFKQFTNAQNKWIKIQSHFIERWLCEEQGFLKADTLISLDTSLIVGQITIIKEIPIFYNERTFNLVLYTDMHDADPRLQFCWYTEQKLSQSIDGTTYLVAESDFSHRLFNQLDTRTTLLEWNDFEDMLHVETTDPTEARYLLPPDIMATIYDSWKKHSDYLGRVKFAGDKIKVVSGLKLSLVTIKEEEERVTLLHEDTPNAVLNTFKLAESLIAITPKK